MLTEILWPWKREKIRDRSVRDVSENITQPIYDMLWGVNLDDFADDIGSRVRDQAWGSIPGEA